MEEFRQALPMIIMVIGVFVVMGIYYYFQNKRLLVAFQTDKHPRTKSISRILIFESLWVLGRINEERAEHAINLAISRYGMGNIKWGHLMWVYQQVNQSSKIEKKTLPNEDGI